MQQSKRTRQPLRTLPSGVPNFDLVLGGGFPLNSTNLIAGPPSAGKTTIANQIAFHNASPARRALYFVGLGEPAARLIRYQQQFSFFDPRLVNEGIFYLDFDAIWADGGLERTFEHILKQVEQYSPALICVDSLRARPGDADDDIEDPRVLVGELAEALAPQEVTVFLLAEYAQHDLDALGELVALDGIVWLERETDRAVARNRLRVVKMRGQDFESRKQITRINPDGVAVIPVITPPLIGEPSPVPEGRAAIGVDGLDRMLRGGIPRGEDVLVAGSPGIGKTLLSLHFVASGVAGGEPAVVVITEESVREHERQAAGFGWDLREWERRGLLHAIYLPPVDICGDHALYQLLESVGRLGAKRVVVDSISGLARGVPPADRRELQQLLHGLMASLASQGVTILLTADLSAFFGAPSLSADGIPLSIGNVIVLRHVEIASRLRRAVCVFKMRTSDHDAEVREFTIAPGRGVEVDRPFEGYTGILSSIPLSRAGGISL